AGQKPHLRRRRVRIRAHSHRRRPAPVRRHHGRLVRRTVVGYVEGGAHPRRAHLPRTGNLARRAAVPARRGGPSETGLPTAGTVLGNKPRKNKLRTKYRRKEEICMHNGRNRFASGKCTALRFALAWVFACTLLFPAQGAERLLIDFDQVALTEDGAIPD